MVVLLSECDNRFVELVEMSKKLMPCRPAELKSLQKRNSAFSPLVHDCRDFEPSATAAAGHAAHLAPRRRKIFSGAGVIAPAATPRPSWAFDA